MITLELKPLLSRLNSYCTRSLEAAAGLCLSKGGYEVSIEHVLLMLLEDPACDFHQILRHYEIDPSRVTKAIQRTVEAEKTGNPRKPVFSSLLIEWIQEAWLFGSVELNLAEIRSGALIAVQALNPRRYGLDEYFSELEPISGDDLRHNFHDIVAGSREAAATIGLEKGAVGGPSAPAADTALAKYTVEFTERARAGEIDPVFCRDHEIRQMIDILMRRRKNNPILVGEAGVGKTAVVEGMALKIVEGDIPDVLKDTLIYGLDLGLLQAGASVKGEFEQRLKSVLSEIKASVKPTILFIDEAHTLIGAGGSAGGSDAANLLKPALARGEMRTIAATTWSEYKKYFEKDPALARRFQLVKVEEPSPEDAVTIMRGLREKYEQAHDVYISDNAVAASAHLAARYLSGRQLPDKSVDLLDTACARVKINLSAKPDQIDDRERRIKTLERELGAIRRDIDTGAGADSGQMPLLEEEIGAIGKELEALEARWDEERAAAREIIALRNRLAGKAPEESPAEGGEAVAPKPVTAAEAKAIRQELAATEAELEKKQGEDPLIHVEVSPGAISKVVSDWTGIPVGNMVKDEARAILSFSQDLGKRIKGQGHAVAAIDRRIRASKAGVNAPNTPIGVFLFVGPSGVGKTECGLGIAELLFGGERFVVTINMSEFQEKHTLSRLIGSPPGYVGYGEGGVLTEAVRQRPYSVVLLDEVEKANPDVLNLFYQVFDKGMLADGEGRVIDFKNTILVLTSNLASDIIMQLAGGDAPPDLDVLTEAIRPVLNNHFKPALLARMEVVPFFPIKTDIMKEIVGLKLGQLGRRLYDSQQIKFQYDPKVVDQIAQRCTEVETGARNIDYIVNKTLLPRISTEILERMAEDSMPETLQIGLDASGDFTYNFTTQ